MSTTIRYKRHKARFMFCGKIFQVEDFARHHPKAAFIFMHLENNRASEVYVSWKALAFAAEAQELASAHGPTQDKEGAHWRVVELSTGNIVIEG